MYEQSTLSYRDPSGRTWQLQGPNQNRHPVVLLRRPVGLFGTGVEVETRRVLNSRQSFRVQTMPQSPNIELVVQVAEHTPKDMATTLQAWFNAWPEDDDDAQWNAPRTGTLIASTPWVGQRMWDVYRTEEMEPLMGVDPLVARRARFLVVASADDPYPYGADVVAKATFVAGKQITMPITNTGEVPVPPRVKFTVPELTDVSVEVTSPAGQRLATFTYKVPGAGTLDLDPNSMTFSAGGEVKPMDWWWSGNGGAIAAMAKLLGVSPEQVPNGGTTLPLALPWGQNADAVLPPGRSTVKIKASKAGSAEVQLTPRYRRLMF